ncbi:hypothetical protein NQ315_011322 [Exocentrus adspersus]|uniref:Uncharacterized protein n=1 Tax=Exocentrus adspersus TaxID=1586481 RepID=A0AAV8VJG9_9CUCU|nr:hypothetical protein NQ315_011322 [Exocentrus adspersus]
MHNATMVELVGFCDASVVAYGAAVYVRVINNNVYINLLCSKSRIAPINKKLTIPRLELNSALLLAELINKVYGLLESKHPLNIEFNLSDPLPEEKVKVFLETKLSDNSFFEKFSNISKLQRVVGYILRFIHNTKSKDNKFLGGLTLPELETALMTIIKHEQKFCFREEIKCLKSNHPIKTNLKSLTPFIDKIGILRVGGRLDNAYISWDQKHPIILPKGNHITNLIINREHLRIVQIMEKN